MMQSNAFLREFVPPSDGVALAYAKQDDSQRKKAYAQGLEDGLAQARGEIEAQTLDAVKSLLSRLEDLTAIRQSMTSEISDEAGRVLASVIRSLCPDLARRGIVERAQHLLENELRDAPRPLSLSVSPEIAGHLETLMADSLDPEVSLVAVETMPATRIEATWPEGGATIDTDDLAARIIAMAAELDPDLDPVEETPHD